MMWSALATLGAAGIGSAASLIGAHKQAAVQKEINERNLQYQEEANKLSVDLANTAHQREVADLRAAGLNPILSAGGSGSSTPQIGAVQAANPYSGFGHSAAEVGRMVASAGREFARYISDQYYLDNKSTEARILREVADTERIEADAYLKRKMADSVKSAQDVFDLGREHVFEPFGSWLGNKLHDWFGTPEGKFRTGSKILYKGRYLDPFEVYQADPEYFTEYMHNRARRK